MVIKQSCYNTTAKRNETTRSPSTWNSFTGTFECSVDVWVGRVSKLVSYFATCHSNYLDFVPDACFKWSNVFSCFNIYLPPAFNLSLRTPVMSQSNYFNAFETALMQERASAAWATVFKQRKHTEDRHNIPLHLK